VGSADDGLKGANGVKQLFKLISLAAILPLAACSSLGGDSYGISDYTLVRVHRVSVGDGSLTVVPPRPWNRHRPTFFVDIREVEDWTLDGPILDGISFVTGLKDGRYLIRQSKRADQQVPKFRDDMTAPEIAAMLESLYRIRGGTVDFKNAVASAAPVPWREQRLPVRLPASRRRRGVA